MRVQSLVVTIFMIMIAVKRVAAGTAGFFKTFLVKNSSFAFHFQLMEAGAVGHHGQIVPVAVGQDIRGDRG